MGCCLGNGIPWKTSRENGRSVNSEICLGFFMVMVTQLEREGDGK